MVCQKPFRLRLVALKVIPAYGLVAVSSFSPQLRGRLCRNRRFGNVAEVVPIAPDIV